MSVGEMWVYLGFFGALVAAGFGLGPPEELALPAAGIAAGVTPELRWWVLLLACIAGVLVADLFLYGVGRLSGDRVLSHRWMRRMVPPAKRLAIERNFHDYGIGILLVGRLVPGIRGPLFLVAGAIRLKLSRFLVADVLGAVLGNSLLFFLGYFLGDQFKDAIKRVEDSLKPVLMVIVLGGIIALLLYYFLRHPVTTGDPEEVPIIGHQVAVHMKPDESCKPPESAAPEANFQPHGEPKAEEHSVKPSGGGAV
jgi:membrane protein DedA with SNARE-associated domain